MPSSPVNFADVTDAATAWAFGVGWSMSKRMSERTARATFQAAADYVWWQRAAGTAQLKSNLARVRPWLTEQELDSLTRSGVRSYMRYWCETFRLPNYTRHRILESFEISGVHLLDDALSQGRGAVIVSGHMGNWDIAGAWAAQRYGAVTSVAEQLKPEKLFDQFLRYRESLGIEVLSLNDPLVMRSLIRRLREGRLVALLGDRDLTDSGILVDFFGGKASFPGGPALLSIVTGAPLHPLTMHYEADRTVGTLLPRIEIPLHEGRSEQMRVMTQQIAYALELGISEYPQDWHMLQKIWVN